MYFVSLLYLPGVRATHYKVTQRQGCNRAGRDFLFCGAPVVIYLISSPEFYFMPLLKAIQEIYRPTRNPKYM